MGHFIHQTNQTSKKKNDLGLQPPTESSIARHMAILLIHQSGKPNRSTDFFGKCSPQPAVWRTVPIWSPRCIYIYIYNFFLDGEQPPRKPHQLFWAQTEGNDESMNGAGGTKNPYHNREPWAERVLPGSDQYILVVITKKSWGGFCAGCFRIIFEMGLCSQLPRKPLEQWKGPLVV